MKINFYFYWYSIRYEKLRGFLFVFKPSLAYFVSLLRWKDCYLLFWSVPYCWVLSAGWSHLQDISWTRALSLKYFVSTKKFPKRIVKGNVIWKKSLRNKKISKRILVTRLTINNSIFLMELVQPSTLIVCQFSFRQNSL